MFEQVTTTYTGADATGEILLIVLVSIILGWIARWVYDILTYDHVYYEDHIHDVVHDHGRTITHDEDIKVRMDEEEEQATDHKVQDTHAQVPEKIESVAAPAPESAPAPVVESRVVAMPYKQDDLKIIEGVGPKIEQLLQEGGLDTWEKLAAADPQDIKTLLRAAGDRYRIHDPTTWPEQAQLAVDHEWDELEEYQDALSGGKDLTRIYKNQA